jgi:hypothetical protein
MCFVWYNCCIITCEKNIIINVILLSMMNYCSLWLEINEFVIVPRKPSSSSLTVHTGGMINRNKLLILPLRCLPFIWRPVNSTIINIIRRDLKILTFISWYKVIIIAVVIFIHDISCMLSYVLWQRNIHYRNYRLPILGGCWFGRIEKNRIYLHSIQTS